MSALTFDEILWAMGVAVQPGDASAAARKAAMVAQRLITEAVEAERERCAALAESHDQFVPRSGPVVNVLACAIRSPEGSPTTAPDSDV